MLGSCLFSNNKIRERCGSSNSWSFLLQFIVWQQKSSSCLLPPCEGLQDGRQGWEIAGDPVQPSQGLLWAGRGASFPPAFVAAPCSSITWPAWGLWCPASSPCLPGVQPFVHFRGCPWVEEQSQPLRGLQGGPPRSECSG